MRSTVSCCIVADGTDIWSESGFAFVARPDELRRKQRVEMDM